jgi:hypothetical protein
VKTDADIERDLAALLDEDARPMPQHVLEAALEGIARRGQVRPRSGWIPRLAVRDSVALGVVAAAAIIVTVFVGPNLLPQLQGWLTELGAGGARMQWDAGLQFRELNPAPDAYGHRIVFSYLRSDGVGHDPQTYVPLGAYEERPEGSYWYDPAFGDPSTDGLSVGSEWGAMTLRPGGGGRDAYAAIVAWRAPVTAPIGIHGRVEVDASCGDGITFTIERDSEVVHVIGLSKGAGPFEVLLERVNSGEVLYFIVDPGDDSRCDTTRLDLTLETR